MSDIDLDDHQVDQINGNTDVVMKRSVSERLEKAQADSFGVRNH